VFRATTAIAWAATVTVTLGLQAVSASAAARRDLAGTAAPAKARAHPAGSVGSSSAVPFELVLALRDKSGAQALARAVSTPGSASYRHYLTAAQWEARFSPAQAQVDQAKSWLASQGFTVGRVSKDRITIAASGSAARVQAAFGTSLGRYKVAGRTERLAGSDLSVPASLAGTIAGVMGVNQSIATPGLAPNPDLPRASSTPKTPAAKPSQFPPAPAAFLTVPPCGAYYGEQTTTPSPPFGQGYPDTVPDVVCGYKPGQYRSAYGVTPAATGKGVTVAVIDAYDSATIKSDATRYFTRNDPGNPFRKAAFTQIDAASFDNDNQDLCDASGWLTEQAIDVEAVHAMAPDAHILYVGAQNCLDGLFDAEQLVIDNGLANVVTNSWGDVAGDLLDDAAVRTANDDEFMLAATTGITVQFSSGDNGDDFELTGFSAPEYPASSPFVTAVGGTTLQIGSDGQRLGELGWNTGRSFLCTANLVGAVPGCTAGILNTWLAADQTGASGGYTSYSYPEPWYQAPVVPAPLSQRNTWFGSTPLRVVPDISLDADPGTGFLIGLHQTLPSGAAQYTETRYGGTSLASPLLAGIVADADQAAGVAVGFLNPAVYRLDVSHPSSIFDVLPEPSLEGNFRVDNAGVLGLGFDATGTATSFRQLYYDGTETYCDGTGNCATRPVTQSAAPGYDSLTGLGAPGTHFVDALAGS